jgi:hypothetical protein
VLSAQTYTRDEEESIERNKNGPNGDYRPGRECTDFILKLGWDSK